MNDLIDRQSLYEAFASIDWWGRNRHEVLTHGAHDESDAFITYKDAVKAIDDAPTIEPKKSQWISVRDERKPKFLERVLVCYCDDVVREGFYRNDFDKWFIYYGFGGLGNVEVEATHWMPLPEPPKEVE